VFLTFRHYVFATSFLPLPITAKHSNIGTYWERGNKNEIDIIAINESEKNWFLPKLNSTRLKSVLTS